VASKALSQTSSAKLKKVRVARKGCGTPSDALGREFVAGGLRSRVTTEGAMIGAPEAFRRQKKKVLQIA
jgi:hypothetical protein